MQTPYGNFHTDFSLKQPVEGEFGFKDASQRFKIDDFEGPLDLLLYLIAKNDVNIYDIPIAEITCQYLAWIENAETKDLDNLTDFYLMASKLLWIKSRMLLPVEVKLEDEIEDPRRELVEKLIEYQRIKKLTDLMEEKEKESEWVIERKRKQRILPFSDSEQMWDEIDVWDLLSSFQNMIKSLSLERIVDLHEEVSINEKITLLEEFIETRDSILFTDLIIHKTSMMEVICAFLAILDCVKLKKVIIFQNRFFGDIQIRKNPHYNEGEDLSLSEKNSFSESEND